MPGTGGASKVVLVAKARNPVAEPRHVEKTPSMPTYIWVTHVGQFTSVAWAHEPATCRLTGSPGATVATGVPVPLRSIVLSVRLRPTVRFTTGTTGPSTINTPTDLAEKSVSNCIVSTQFCCVVELGLRI